MNPSRRPIVVLIALTVLLAPTWAAAQIGLPLAELAAVAALQLETAEGETTTLARTEAGTELRLEERGSALARVGGEAVFDEETIADVARVIAAATGYFDAIEEPVAGYLRQNLPSLAGTGPSTVGVESFRLSLDVSGTAPPYRVVWSVALTEVPEQAFLPVRHAIGPDDARYVIREFSDLQCPFCARFAEQVFPAIEATLLARGDVRFEYHHLVLGGRFANSGLAAEATECVADANPDDPAAFWSYLGALFERQQAWSALADPAPFFARLPLEIGLANDGVDACLDARTHLETVQASTERAAEIGVRGTPTVFVGPYQLRDFTRIESYLEAMARIDAFGEAAAGVATPED
jgi:protein-disulfide isomerase